MIPDEPSSGLDAHAEARLHAELRRRTGRTTQLLISHRLNAVREADQFVVMAQDRVVQQAHRPGSSPGHRKPVEPSLPGPVGCRWPPSPRGQRTDRVTPPAL